jgi:hypothetical protein
LIDGLSGNEILIGSDGNGAIAAIRFASLTGAPTLTTAEFKS